LKIITSDDRPGLQNFANTAPNPAFEANINPAAWERRRGNHEEKADLSSDALARNAYQPTVSKSS